MFVGREERKVEGKGLKTKDGIDRRAKVREEGGMEGWVKRRVKNRGLKWRENFYWEKLEGS